jgi:multimeric flavodoxin WrbA
MYVTAVYGSPRKDGNTDLLLQSCLRAMREQGIVPHEIALRDLQFSPCIECGGCAATGVCVLRDGMDSMYPHFLKSDIIILAAPVFFYGLNALAKAMVDRAQCFWAKKYLLGQKVRDPGTAPGKGVLLSAGGSRGQKNFDGILLTVRYFFDALDMPLTRHLLLSGIDAKAAVREHPTACSDAYALGKTLFE